MQNKYYKHHEAVNTPWLNLFINKCVESSTDKDSLNSVAPAPSGLSRPSPEYHSSPRKAVPLLAALLLASLQAPVALPSLSIKLQSSHPFSKFQREELLLFGKKRYFFILNKLSRTIFKSLCTFFPFLNNFTSQFLNSIFQIIYTLLLVQIINSFQSISALNRLGLLNM